MRVSTLLPFLALVAGAIATVTPTARDECATPGAEMCNTNVVVSPGTPALPVAARAPAPAPSTNAQRLARGLPPAPPRKRGRHHSPSRTRTCSPSPLPPVTYRGVIQVTDADNNETLGFVAAIAVNGGAQAGYTPDQTAALIVDFTLPHGHTSGTELDLTTENNFQPFTLFGLVQGRDDSTTDFAAGSFQYGYFDGTDQTAPGATPQMVANGYFIGAPRAAESAVWTIDVTTGAMTVQWINSDGTKPTTLMWTQSTGLYVGGDQNAFFARYPAPVSAISLKFIPL